MGPPDMPFQQTHRVDKLAADNRKLRRKIQELEKKCNLLITSQRAMSEVLQTFQSTQSGIASLLYEDPFQTSSVPPIECMGQLMSSPASTIPFQSCQQSPRPRAVSVDSVQHEANHTFTDSAYSPVLVGDILHETERDAILDESLLETYDDILTLDKLDVDNSNGFESNLAQTSTRARTLLPLLNEPTVLLDLSNIPSLGLVSGALDGYIEHVHQSLKEKAIDKCLTWEKLVNVTKRCVLWIVREAWPKAEHYWRTTGSFEGFLAFEMWRAFPCQQTYQALHPAYRPTPTQLSQPHPAIIDWLPWPSIRDNLIQYQDDIDVDLVCKSAIENVVAHRGLARQRPHSEGGNDTSALPVSFRVYDLCLLEAQSGCRPVPDGDLVYKSKSAPVKALEQAYRLECNNFLTQRLHPSFFDAYPGLYCESAVSNFEVQSLVAIQSASKDVGYPVAISRNAKTNLGSILATTVALPTKRSRTKSKVNK